MSATYLGVFEPGTDVWWDARRGGLGGSEIAAVVGLSPWTSAYTLWQQKAGNVTRDEGFDEFKIWLGHQLEEAVCQAWMLKGENRFLKPTGMWVNEDRPFQFADPDRLIVSGANGRKARGIFEAKTADSSKSYEWGSSGGGNDDIPPYYLTQVLWYLSTFGLEEGWLGVIISGREYREYRIRSSAEDEAWLIREAESFLASLEAGIPPDIDGSDSTFRSIKALHPDVDPEQDQVITLAEARDFLNVYQAWKNSEAEWQHAKNLAADRLGMGHRLHVDIGGDLIPVASRRPPKPGLPPTLYPASKRAQNQILGAIA